MVRSNSTNRVSCASIGNACYEMIRWRQTGNKVKVPTGRYEVPAAMMRRSSAWAIPLVENLSWLQILIRVSKAKIAQELLLDKLIMLKSFSSEQISSNAFEASNMTGE